MAANAGKCPYCARRRRECWNMPCLQLQVDLEKGVKAVQKWAGQNFIVALKEPGKGTGGPRHAS